MLRRRYLHDMPFGAEPLPDRGVRFRLWAPAAESVALVLSGDATRPMRALEEGWWELVSEKAGPGSLYHFLIDDETMVPDPASRYQPQDVHGPSEVIDPLAFDWGDRPWRGRPWHETVIYELHVGAFAEGGGFPGIEAHLDHLARLGVTALELMPLADFPGARNWGYDGVFPFAPDAAYGRPGELKHLIRAAHRRGLQVFLDVVYNHFGPEGNYLHRYAPGFFSQTPGTPWGEAIDFDGPASSTVRRFFIHNALYWLEEYQLDGLRLDSVHTIHDRSKPDILEELATAVAEGPGSRRRVHLMLENDNNAAHYLQCGYVAQWNDDFHHALHLLLTGEREGYYGDYAEHPLGDLGRCLAEGFAYQGEPSVYRNGRRRGEPSAGLPPTAFILFLQNHDQVGNRACGERLAELVPVAALRAATTLLLLAPSPPLLFMGEEWGTQRRFPYFCDFGPPLAQAVTEGRRNEFSDFAGFREPAARARIPDPEREETFAEARLQWHELKRSEARQWFDLYRRLLALRRREIMPRLQGIGGGAGTWREIGGQGLEVIWRLAGGGALVLRANLAPHPLPAGSGRGRRLYATHPDSDPLPPWYVAWSLSGEGEG